MKTLLTNIFLVLAVSLSAQNFKNITEASNGFIGIGTKNPDALLTVKGTIHTQEVLVDLDGAVAPDYVFETYFTGKSDLKIDYRLRSLEEVEIFVEKHHHLPGIPTALQMEEEGVSLKEMNLLLLEKIEELTLYAIEQNKEINQLKSRIEVLENE
ncbi:MAG TPA: hypothetical protein VKZ42_07195 [Flavobacteriaceae bacterium]|nr:hypothetical protein [Flavobacteriaceae bacterium]